MLQPDPPGVEQLLDLGVEAEDLRGQPVVAVGARRGAQLYHLRGRHPRAQDPQPLERRPLRLLGARVRRAVDVDEIAGVVRPDRHLETLQQAVIALPASRAARNPRL